MRVIIALTLFSSIFNDFSDAGKPRPPPPSATTSSSVSVTVDTDSVDDVVKGYIDAGTCDTVTTGSLCEDDATSYYSEFEYNGYRVIVANGIPDHDAEEDMLSDENIMRRCERWTYMKVPLNPSKGTSVESTSMGVIALATTGGTFYNDLSTTDGDVALYNEGTTLDSCNGHSSSDNQYHYHAVPACADSYANATACELVGYARDGVPIYGYCNDATGTQFTSCYSISSGYSETEMTIASGTYYSASMDTYYEFNSDGCNLDEANGAIHPTTGEYSYFLTTTFPWVPKYYYGEDGASDLCSAA